MAEILDAYFHNNPKINVVLQRSARKHMVFGDNLLVWAHGEKLNAEGWQGVVAAEFAPQWGITKHRHLKMGHIHHAGKGVFAGLPSPLQGTRYHSLVVERESLPDCLEVTAWLEDGTIMGLRHKDLPIEGVQFHPESIRSEHGHAMLRSFLQSVPGALQEEPA